ncbi:MAG: VWA domain-containing protein [Deltaproteobacteria bacterium]|nr:VWA domain-containing protein [Deltaproteobacteria bacterium]
MKLAVAFALAGSVATAHARGSFNEYGTTTQDRPATQLFEASCDVDIELRGAVAAITMRQRIVNPGPGDLAASFELELPRGAQVTSFTMRGQHALLVDAKSPVIEGGTSVLGVDPAVLQREGGDDYRVVLQPITADHDVMLETRFVAVAEPRGGGLRLVLPGRAAAGRLTACKGTFRASAGPGATIKKLRIDGADAGTTRAAFTVDARDVAIEVELDLHGREPILWTQTQPLAGGWNASLVTVLGPRIKPPGTRRVVFVVDGSRSMDLVGRHHVVKVLHGLGAALPSDAEVEAIVFDRTVTRVFGELRPANPQNLAAIEAAVARRGASNGSDLVGAFAKAREVIDGARGQAMVIVISDGVTGDIDGGTLTRALGAKTSSVDVHAIVLNPASTASPGAETLRSPVNLFGGSFVEVSVDALAHHERALAGIEEWLRPAWLEIAIPALGDAIPKEVRAGSGFTHLTIHRGAPRFVMTGHGDRAFTVTARPAPGAPVGALAMANVEASAFTTTVDPGDDELARLAPLVERARAAHPVADAGHAFAVLTSAGRVAANRRAVVRDGGRYERVIALADPPRKLAVTASPVRLSASAIARPTLERLFRDQLQPKAYVCYQRALGRNADLAGTVTFQLRMGRGEVTEVVLGGLGDAALDACLVEAAYQLTPPLPDFTVNADDQTIANYPLTFNRRADQPMIVLGDADSSSPLEIDSIQGGVPRRPTRVDTSTPLGRLRPSKSP